MPKENKKAKAIQVLENKHYLGLKDKLDELAEKKKISTASMILGWLQRLVDSEND